LGGSVASAAVNLTQPMATTLPYLSQFGGVARAAKALMGAAKDMATRGFKYDAKLAEALKRAEDKGTVSPQEIHYLMGQARGQGHLRAGGDTKLSVAQAMAANAWSRSKLAWGQMFGAAEQVNRRMTFIAAFRLAEQQGMANPYAFATKAVDETQFVQNKANKMEWGRSTLGGTLMTFKSYSIAYLELMGRMWNAGEPGSAERKAGRKAVLLAAAVMMLLGGAGGLPFMQDAEDVATALGKMLGYNWDAKQARQELLQTVFGKEFADFADKGLSGLPGVPIDVSGRLGMGNLIPGTGLLQPKTDYSRDYAELLGPAGDFAGRVVEGGKQALAGIVTGDVGKLVGGAMVVAPTAVRNLAKGYDMASTGMYRDTKGRRVMATTGGEAFAKAMGFQPASVAADSEATSFKQRSMAFYTQTSADIKAQWAEALFTKDEAALQRVRERLAAWNRDNPDQRIVVKMPDVWKRVREMSKDRAQRIADTAPKALRQRMREELRPA
ncbi:MAG: PLxRFG domain-containing protein, partial [Thermomicrobiales bacterium]